jgi:hypothetical protein
MELVIGSNRILNTSGVLNVAGSEQVFLETSEDGQLLLTMDIYDAQGQHIAKLRRNAWAFNQVDRFSITTNPRDLTLTDTASGQLVVSAKVVGRSTIEIPEGEFFTHNGHLLEITPEYWRIDNSITMSGNTIDSCGGAVAIR